MDRERIDEDLQRISVEYAELKRAVDAYRLNPSGFNPDWTIKNSISAILQSVYTNIENVLEVLLKETDNYRPGGDSHHKDILERVSSPIVGVREEIISPELKAHLIQLLGFRHVVRKRYAQEINLTLALANVDRAESAVPMFRIEVERFLEKWISVDREGDRGG